MKKKKGLKGACWKNYFYNLDERVNECDLSLNVGVYSIVNVKNGKFYVGSTFSSFNKRRMEHLHYLRSGTHHSVVLQRAYNKYGESCFKFKILHEVPHNYVRVLEQWYLNTQPCEYNSSKCSTGGLNQNSKSKESIIKKLEDYCKYKGDNSIEAYKQANLDSDLLYRILIGKSYSYYNIPEELLNKCREVRSRCRAKYWKGLKRKKSTIEKISIKNKGRGGKKVIDTKTGVVYKTIAEAAQSENLHQETLRCYLNNKRKNITTLKFYEEES